ncbi:hypothetical protein [Pseudomonas putida]
MTPKVVHSASLAVEGWAGAQMVALESLKNLAHASALLLTLEDASQDCVLQAVARWCLPLFIVGERVGDVPDVVGAACLRLPLTVRCQSAVRAR